MEVTMHETIKKLLAKGPVITDGAWGTELMKKGMKANQCPEIWNLTDPEKVGEVAKSYVDAGSRVILTNTFGANRFVLVRYNMEDKVREINIAGVDISKEAAGDQALVFASMGPSGKMLIMKDVTEKELQEAFEEQADAIKDAGADAIIIETMTDITEAIIAIAAAKKTTLPLVASMVFDAGKEKDRTIMGHTIEEMVEKFTSAGVDVLGTNCGKGIEGFIPVCEKMRTNTNLPLWIKANAGSPEYIKGETVYNTTPEEYASYVPVLVQAGADFIGGCCGTNPDFIRAIKDKLAC
jgi:5-methyltetrahydrofolate--homocysteine methyltransferase